MKNGKKFVALLLAVIMVMAFGTSVFAADNDGTITVSNATKGETYAVYKVFDLTYSGDNVSYSFTADGADDAFLAALKGADSPFTLTQTTTANKYTVSLTNGKSTADVAAFLKKNEGLLTQIGASVKADSNTVTFTDLPYGYYYITSSLGTVVTIDSAKKDVEVIDKNQTPGWDPLDPENPDQTGDQGKFVADSADGPYDKTNTASIGDTAYFKINAYAPKYAGDKLVADYIFTDTLANGFTINDDLKVTLNGKTLAAGTDYTVSQDGQKITVTVKAGADYPVEAHISITYSADVNENAVYDNTNTVSMKWTVYPNDNNGDPNTGETPYDPNDPNDQNNPGKDPSDPENPEDSETDTYSFGFKIQKTNDAGTELTGAKFKLYDAATGGKEIPVVLEDGVYRVAEAGETGVEIEAGTAQIFGLREGAYYLEETVAPAGYNMLTEREEIVINQAGDADKNGYMDNITKIINKTGSLLPSTGGMGTTLFYIVGAVLLLGAVILLVVRRRMRTVK